ncbi:MAG TPA: hypothetical protein VN917_05290, partial [Xanthobacteraceae bacterium]|nr:hypothetical protein [Xanthobacteraceae bacterium]
MALLLFACSILPPPAAQAPMSDYYPLLSRIVAGLNTDTGESRRALYGRARAALCEQLRGHEPPLPESEITHERLALEAAIRKFEAEAIRRPRNRPLADLRSAATIESLDARPLEVEAMAVMQAELAPAAAGAQPVAQCPAPREQLVKLVLLAQVAEAREQHVRRAPEMPSAGQRDNFLNAIRQRGRAVVQRISSSPQQVQQEATPPDVLTSLVEARQRVRPGSDGDPSSRPTRRSVPDAPST